MVATATATTSLTTGMSFQLFVYIFLKETNIYLYTMTKHLFSFFQQQQQQSKEQNEMLLNYFYKMGTLPQAASAQNPYGYGLTPEQMKQFAAYQTHGHSMDQLLALYQQQAQQQYTYLQMQQQMQNYGNSTAASRKQMQAYEQMLAGGMGQSYAATLKWQQQQQQQ